jgi:CheY-like chemotaxis protein
MTPCQTILVVENDQSVREAVALLISQVGYEVILAGSGRGEEALDLMSEVDSLDGLYTDIALDGFVDGWIVGERFRHLWPLRPIVYASGISVGSRRLLGHETFLRKPFDPQALWQAFKADAVAFGRAGRTC